MADILLNDNLQPIFESGDYLEVSGEDEAHQLIRMAAQDNLFGISSRYDRESIENKIRLEINRIARETDFIDSVEDITVSRVQADEEENTKSGYHVEIFYNQSESYTEIIQGL